MSDLEAFRNEQLKDPEFKKYYTEMQPYADLSKAIVDARLKRGFTQQQLSSVTGISQANISRLESCEGNPSFKKLLRIAQGLNMRLKISFEPFGNEEDAEDI